MGFAPDRPWQFRVGKRDVSLMPESSVRLGIIQVPKYMAEHHVKRGRLVEILHRYRPAPMPISLGYPSRRHIPLRVRVLADALAEQK